ncbi:uncharacterized protein TM35_000152130 [Trypanosoma theileri]|uniref:Uncharacterized protein n=1 Tax=Trypanosoma theileri TaxID=67003 RepID=A0A1X0NVT5_9TRYP|nr:uncharacterized protein TM35_000152130 [Trypanosoma theileri]ORC88782.1 hypothetical protein TM35_000152130 [Trypanosoma theileri]
MISRKGLAIAAVTLLALFVVVMPSPVSAQDSLECEKVWKGPSAKNSMVDCVKNSDRIKDQLTLALPFFNILLLVVILLGFPISIVIMFLFTNIFEATIKKITLNSPLLLWMWITYTVLWGCCMLILVVSGAKTLIKYSPSIFEKTLEGPLVYFNETAERIIDFTSNWSTGERVPLSSFEATIAPLTKVQTQVKTYTDLYEKNFLGYVDKLASVSYSISSIGFVIILSLLPLAFFRFSNLYILLGASCVYWIFGILFAVFGLSMSVLSVYLSAGCGEVELHHQRKPGVFQWYLIPLCQSMFSMDSIREQVRRAEFQYSRDGCNKLLRACDDNDPDLTKGPPEPTNASAPAPAPAAAPAPAPASPNNTSRKPLAVKASKVKLRSPYSESGGTITRDKLQLNLGGGGGGGGGGKGGNTLANALANAIATSRKTGSSTVKLKLPKAFDKFKIYKGLGSKEITKKLQDALQRGYDINTITSIAARPFKCGKNITSSDQCTDFDTMADVLIATTVKKVTSLCPKEGVICNLTECASHCRNEEFRAISKRMLDAALMARNASIAVSYVKPLLECNFVVDKFSVALTNCNELRRGAFLLGMGFFVGGLMFGLAIYIIIQGSYLWKLPIEKGDDTHSKGISDTHTSSIDTLPSDPSPQGIENKIDTEPMETSDIRTGSIDTLASIPSPHETKKKVNTEPMEMSGIRVGSINTSSGVQSPQAIKKQVDKKPMEMSGIRVGSINTPSGVQSPQAIKKQVDKKPMEMSDIRVDSIDTPSGVQSPQAIKKQSDKKPMEMSGIRVGSINTPSDVQSPQAIKNQVDKKPMEMSDIRVDSIDTPSGVQSPHAAHEPEEENEDCAQWY